MSLVESCLIEDLVALLFPPAPSPDAEWQDFRGMGESADLMRKLLTKALANGTPGVNILLYGAPGAGKTEFCKVLGGSRSSRRCWGLPGTDPRPM